MLFFCCFCGFPSLPVPCSPGRTARLGALKLLAEDLRAGSPGAAFASLVHYGTALILAPRLLRGTK
jgi:hypothetical protein